VFSPIVIPIVRELPLADTVAFIPITKLYANGTPPALRQSFWNCNKRVEFHSGVHDCEKMALTVNVLLELLVAANC